MTESNYNSERLQSNPGYIKWWEEDKEITDSELKNGRGS
jgi:preprotein translocase subunit Sec61beta